MNNRILKIETGLNITDNDIYDFIEMDNEFYPEELRGTFEICKKWHNRNPEIFIALRDLSIDKSIGCINLMPLTDRFYKIIESGNFNDLETPVEDIVRYDKPGIYKVCLVSIVLKREYQNSEAIKILYEAFIDKLLNLAKRNIYFSEMISDTISPDGEKFCSSIGMEKYNSTFHSSNLYKVYFFPFELGREDNKTKLLKEVYSNIKNINEFSV